MARSNEIDMTSGNILLKMFKYAIPLALSGILQLLYNAADLIVCGIYGSQHATAAISSTNALINLIVNLFLGLATGANILMARCYGANNKEKGQRVVYTAMISSIFIGVFIGLFGFVFSRTFLEMMGTTSDVIDLSATYLKIYFIGLPASMVYNFGAALLRAVGDTKKPFYFLGISGLFNVLFNLLFVIVFKMDVAGVALATIIAQFISAIFVIVSLFKNKGFFHFNLKEMKFYKKEALEVIRIGFPAGLQGVIFSISNVMIQSSVNSLGTDIVGGNGAANSLEGFVYTAMNAASQGCVAFVSANFGARKKENIKKSILSAAVIVLFMNAFFGSLILLFRYDLISLYVHTQLAVDEGIKRLILIISTNFICGLMDCMAYALRGVGYSVTPMIISLTGVCGIRMIWIFGIFPMERFHSLTGLLISYPISWLVTGMIHLLMFIHIYRKKLLLDCYE